MFNVPDLIKRGAEKCGFIRERFNEARMPTDISNVVVMPFFSDFRNTFIASSLLVKRYREDDRASKYFIMASWPGQQCLYPYVDEYWSLPDDPSNRRLYHEADGFDNKADLMVDFVRNFNNHFLDVVEPSVLNNFYQNGLTVDYFRRFRQVICNLPMVPSTGVLSKDFVKDLANRAGFKVFVSPLLWARTWKYGKEHVMPVRKEFYIHLIRRLIRHNYVPVVWQNTWTHDISPDFTSECVYVTDSDLSHVLGVMRATGCVLDLFNGISRLALAARCPFLACDERQRYANTKEFEIDGLCGSLVPKEYLFCFSTILDGPSSSWDGNLFNNVVNRLDGFLPELNRDLWPSTAESSDVVSYESVKRKKIIKIGAKLFKLPKE